MKTIDIAKLKKTASDASVEAADFRDGQAIVRVITEEAGTRVTCIQPASGVTKDGYFMGTHAASCRWIFTGKKGAEQAAELLRVLGATRLEWTPDGWQGICAHSPRMGDHGSMIDVVDGQGAVTECYSAVFFEDLAYGRRKARKPAGVFARPKKV